jgi:cytoskeleton protein RodZ
VFNYHYGAGKKDQENMGSFGERMRREREMRGIKLEEITESTKISKRNLLALEDEHFDRLPGGIFNKGFVRAYARFLGLDEDQAVQDFLIASADYDQPLALQPPGSETSVVKPPVIPSEASEKRKDLAWVLAALLVLSAGGSGWYYLNYGRMPLAPNQASAGAPPARGVVPAQVPLPVSAAKGSGDKPASAARSAGVSPELKSNSASVTGPAGTVQRAVVLAIKANQPTWVSMTVDGKPYMAETMAAGNERTIEARERIVLRTGNAGGLEVSYNGQPAAPAGRDGQVRTITFPPRGINQ